MVLFNKIMMTCECHKINWLARVRNPDKKYLMVDGSPLKEGVDCHGKVCKGVMDYDTYIRVCKYRPGTEGSRFPYEVFMDIMAGVPDTTDDPNQITLRNTPVICQQHLEWNQYSVSEMSGPVDALGTRCNIA